MGCEAARGAEAARRRGGGAEALVRGSVCGARGADWYPVAGRRVHCGGVGQPALGRAARRAVCVRDVSCAAWARHGPGCGGKAPVCARTTQVSPRYKGLPRAKISGVCIIIMKEAHGTQLRVGGVSAMCANALASI